jgi:hypothetical protein
MRDFVRLLSSYEGFLAPPYDSRAECGAAVQRAFQHLAASHSHLGVLRGPLSAMRAWFEEDVGEFVDYLQSDRLSKSFKI